MKYIILLWLYILIHSSLIVCAAQTRAFLNNSKSVAQAAESRQSTPRPSNPPPIIKIKPQNTENINSGVCQIPSNIVNSNFAVNCKRGQPGQRPTEVSEFSLLTLSCKPGYAYPDGQGLHSFCVNKTWNPPLPICIKTCNKLSVPDTTYTCHQNGTKIDCNKPFLPGTEIRFSCQQPFYYPTRSNIICNKNGDWSATDIKCVSECGSYTAPNEKNQTQINASSFPWTVLIHYFHKDQWKWRSGILISPNLVLTNAFVEDLPAKFVQVSATSTQGDSTVHQVRQLKRLKNLTLLALNEEFPITSALQPVCLDWNKAFPFANSSSITGKISLFQNLNTSSTEPQTSTNETRIIDVLAFKNATCSILKSEKKLTVNLFCAVFQGIDGILSQNIGTGFVSKSSRNKLYYLHGILSAVKSSNRNIYFISVDEYMDPIEKISAKESLNEIVTYLESPTYESHGDESIWYSSNHSTIIYDTFNVSCRDGSFDLKLKNGCILPKRQRFNLDYKVTCPANAPRSVSKYCQKIGDGSAVPLNTVLQFSCKPGYTSEFGNSGSAVCSKGIWYPSLIPCRSAQKAELPNPANSKCSKDQLSCDSSKCVSRSKLCDGIPDCEDNSDERTGLCTSLKLGCRVPESNADTVYSLNCKHNEFNRTHIYVPEFSILFSECKPGYGHKSGHRFHSVCLNNVWEPEIPSCVRTCKKPMVTDMTYTCHRHMRQVNCDKPYISGTTLRLSCKKPLYYPLQQEITCNEDGNWSSNEVRCEADCGTYSRESLSGIKGKLFPWTVLFVERRVSEPGTFNILTLGVLVTPNVVLSNGQLFVNINDTQTRVNFENIYIYNETAGVETSTGSFRPDPLKIIEIKSVTRKQDLVISVLREKLTISSTLLPACLDWSGTDIFSNLTYTVGKINVIGEAFNRTEPFYNETNIFDVRAYNSENCADLLYENYVPDNTHFCVDYPSGENFAINDLGTGFIVKNKTNQLYYVHGIMNGGSLGKPGIFLKLSIAINDIKAIIENERITETLNFLSNSNKPTEKPSIALVVHSTTHNSLVIGCDGEKPFLNFTGGCTLPNRNNYNFEYQLSCPVEISNLCQRPIDGVAVPEQSILKTDCSPGYVVNSDINKYVCFNNNWYPEILSCTKLCNSLKPRNSELKCRYKGAEIGCNNDMFPGTVVTATCLSYYSLPTQENTEVICQEDGEWNNVIPECNAICGSPSVNISNTSDDKRNAERGEFPWHIAIYDTIKGEEDSVLICGGTIISEYAILSAAHCFINESTNTKRKNTDFDVAVAKIFNSYTNTDFGSYTEFYKIEEIHLDNFQGVGARYRSDIAILQLRKRIVYNELVMPVCLYANDAPHRISSLQVAGWGIPEDSDTIDLRIVRVPYFDLSECIARAADDAETILPYLSKSQFCIGSEGDTEIYGGDSGGGLILQDNARYYVIGIVSYKTQELPNTAVVTNVNQYLNWIKLITDGIKQKKDA